MPITPFGRIRTALHMFPCRQDSVNLCPSTLLRHDLMHRIPEGSTISKFASAACRVHLFPGFADLLTHDRLATHGSNHDRYLPWPNATALLPLSSIVAHSLVPQLTATLVEPAQRHQIDQSNGKVALLLFAICYLASHSYFLALIPVIQSFREEVGSFSRN